MMRMSRPLIVAALALSLAACFGGKKVPPTLLTLTSAAPLPASIARTVAAGEALTIDVPVISKELSTTRLVVRTTVSWSRSWNNLSGLSTHCSPVM